MDLYLCSLTHVFLVLFLLHGLKCIPPCYSVKKQRMKESSNRYHRPAHSKCVMHEVSLPQKNVTVALMLK